MHLGLVFLVCSFFSFKLTHWTHLRDARNIWFMLELGDIVIDVLHLDDKL